MVSKLIHIPSNQVILEFHNQQVIFHNEYLRREMEGQGVVIPDFLKEFYDGKQFVKLNDDNFKEAFRNIYCRFVLDDVKYRWEED